MFILATYVHKSSVISTMILQHIFHFLKPRPTHFRVQQEGGGRQGAGRKEEAVFTLPSVSFQKTVSLPNLGAQLQTKVLGLR